MGYGDIRRDRNLISGNPYSVAFITAVNNDELYNKCKSYIAKLNIPECIEKIELIPIYGAKSMCSAYNLGMSRTNAKYKVYLHQDLMITDENFLNIMIDCFQRDPERLYALGVAGCKTIPESGVWWEGYLVGQFYDTHTGGDVIRRYTYEIDPVNILNVEALDGCIICTQFDLYWEEDLFNKWHYYDTSQIYKAIKLNYKAGILPSKDPLVTHLCGIPGMDNFDTERRKFVRNYINPNLNILVCCCGGATGGIELLHQLVYHMNQQPNVSAKMWYIEANPDQAHNWPEYEKYNTPFVDNTYLPLIDSVVVVPEIWAYWTNYRFKNCQKVIYWESVDNYIKSCPKGWLYKIPEDVIHIVQSYYAYDFVINTLKIDKNRVFFVSDYLNDMFDGRKRKFKRLPQVLYNPKKDKIANKLIAKFPDIKFKPIEHMTVNQVVEAMYKSMVYIDFGPHPGKDRMPREAAMCGCNVITGTDGAAKYKEDVNIPYKVDYHKVTIESIGELIKEMINNYDEFYESYDNYRSEILEERTKFISQVENFCKALRRI